MLGEFLFFLPLILAAGYAMFSWVIPLASGFYLMWHNFTFRTKIDDMYVMNWVAGLPFVGENRTWPVFGLGVYWIFSLMLTSILFGNKILDEAGKCTGWDLSRSEIGYLQLWLYTPIVLTYGIRFVFDIIRSLRHNFKTGESERINDLENRLKVAEQKLTDE